MFKVIAAALLLCVAPPTTALSDDAAWSWWTHPLAVEQDGQLWVGSISSTGRVQVHIDGQLVEIDQVEPNDHSAPALAAGHVFYSRHAQDNLIRYRTITAEGIGEMKTIAFPHTVAYAQPLVYGDTIVLLTRSSVCRWYAAISTDQAETWSEPVLFIDGCPQSGQLYVTTSTHPSKSAYYRLAVYGHPNNSAWDRIEYGLIRLDNGRITIPGNAEVANIYTGQGLPITYGELDTAFAADSFRLLDVGTVDGYPAIAVADWSDGVPRYRTVHWSSNGWSTVDVGRYASFFWEHSAYVGGAVFGNGSLITSSLIHDVGMIEQWTWDDGWVSECVLATADVPLIRPYVVRDSNQLIIQGTSHYLHFEDYSTSAMATGLGCG